jgi:hypothetical protein
MHRRRVRALVMLLPAALVAGCHCGGAGGRAQPVGAEPESRALLQRWLAAHAPGEDHRRLDVLAGEWTLAGWWRAGAAPDGPRSALSGEVDAAWILDGRFLEVRCRGTTEGLAYTGLQLLGYNVLAHCYQLIVLESTTTVINEFTGVFDEKTGSIVFTGTIADPAASGSYRGVLELGAGRHVFKGFNVTGDGREIQVSEYVYTPRPR